MGSRRIQGNLKIANKRKNCALVVDGEIDFATDDPKSYALILDGAMHIKQEQNAVIAIKGLDCFNEGQKIVPKRPDEIDRDFKKDPESYKIRGYASNLRLEEMYTMTKGWNGGETGDGDLKGGGTFKIKEKKEKS